MSMRETRRYVVACDGCDVSASNEEEATEHAASTEAEKWGWTTTLLHGGDDLCPTCLRSRYQQYQENERQRKEAAKA